MLAGCALRCEVHNCPNTQQRHCNIAIKANTQAAPNPIASVSASAAVAAVASRALAAACAVAPVGPAAGLLH
jgi:hypothetical protein